MEEKGENGKYDLEDRTFAFAGNVRRFIRRLPKTLANTEDTRQVIRSSGSVGANYIEANEALAGAPETVNDQPEGAGWFARVRLADKSQYEGLMDRAAYEAFLGTL